MKQLINLNTLKKTEPFPVVVDVKGRAKEEKYYRFSKSKVETQTCLHRRLRY
jgi:hypothetical protein